ncbi:MAG: cupin domain-containing protein, partial [Gammaproteobacteria bacterium]|nr:cupin domain-containing protein [Gammaproteobacteria bacterium]
MTPVSISLPPGIDRATFVRDYWQKKPLLLRGAMPPAAFPLSPDELAGLACEDEIEARLMIQTAADAWQVRHGPFDEQDFAELPERDWTLLVQDVDKYVPAVGQLIDAFDFVPGWRIDD